MLNSSPILVHGRFTRLVLDDPDIPTMDEEYDIGVFVPGQYIEREVDWDRLLNVLFLTFGGFLITVVLTTVMIVPMAAVGLIDMFSPGLFKPWSMLILSFAELGFIVTPIYYVRKHRLPLTAIGIRDMRSLKNMALGIVTGVAMLGGNLFISWLISDVFRIPVTGDEELFAAIDVYELVGWVVVMFVIVGFTEELIFRGFLQRRMEMYFRRKGKNAGIKAIIITSFIFAAIHLDVVGFATRFMLGVFLGFLAQRTKYSMIGPTIAHGLNNAVVVIMASMFV